ncbi:MAG: hypothetical protein P8L85_05855 [Rubripirellula sp.]|nr:hypothetical protein [Rubripirellula sp.]
MGIVQQDAKGQPPSGVETISIRIATYRYGMLDVRKSAGEDASGQRSKT